MIDFLKNWVFNIVTLVIIIVLVEILLPSGKVRKFVNLISGFILIIAIINPFLGLFKNGVDLKEFEIASSNFIDKNEIEKDSKILNESQIKQITEVYRGKLISQLESSTNGIDGITSVKADVIMNEDYTSDAFGEIKRVYLDLVLDTEKSDVKPVTKVEKVEIGKTEKKEKKTDRVDNEMKEALENRINKLLGVEKENIVISVQDE